MKINVLLIICLTWYYSEARPTKLDAEVGQPFLMLLKLIRRARIKCTRSNDFKIIKYIKKYQ